MASQPDISDLISRCCQGDDVAYAEFYNQFQPYISGVVAQQLRKLGQYHDKSDIDDLTNDIFLKFLAESYRSFKSVRSATSIYGWLYVVVKNFVISDTRRQIRGERTQEDFMREHHGGVFA